MKLRISKKWWQFWLPQYVEVVEAEAEKDAASHSRANRHNTVSEKRGRVVQATHAKWKPATAAGGKVVKLMPKQLKEIKKAQEKPDVVQSLPE